MENEVLDKWLELKTLVEVLEVDLLKNARGAGAAGGRARKGLRLLKNTASELVKMSINLDKTRKAAKVKQKV